ncbi:DoxX family protein [Bradyrhizobium xenonodulans]|uniref:DoxX family protein n=1 Tax=Bradyrhizobium xenonodulans TaxID=2736875 RepID=A0ABY7MIL2_9BRAD|nr:DoxX family protein [Bradyrhizobium xenonodulans]WBL77426.1 DoxX family protein [Bradyrhizobium xenonodulans]
MLHNGNSETGVVLREQSALLSQEDAYLRYFAESVAAACLAIGLFTRIAAAIVGIEMIVIVFLFQWQFGYFWTNRGYEYALLWAVLCIAVFFKGGGRYSIDRLIGREF